MKNSFVFYGSWWEAIKNLPRDVQGDVLTAIIEYGLSGETTGQLKPIAKAMLAMVKPQIDVNNQRFENGLKGGRQRKNGIKTEPNNNQNKTETEPNNVNVNGSSNEDKKESPNGDEKENVLSQSASANPDFIRFNVWLKENAPYCADTRNFGKQMTESEFIRLKTKYTGKQIADTISQIENRKDLRKRYSDLYRTTLNWLKRDYGG